MPSDLEHSESATAAATAIRNVCSSCGTILADSHLDVLLQLYQKVQGQGAAVPAGAQKQSTAGHRFTESTMNLCEYVVLVNITKSTMDA